MRGELILYYLQYTVWTSTIHSPSMYVVYYAVTVSKRRYDNSEFGIIDNIIAMHMILANTITISKILILILISSTAFLLLV